MLRDDMASACRVLGDQGLTYAGVGAGFLQLAPHGPGFVLMGKLPMSRALRATMISVAEEAEALGHAVVEVGHVLLGLARAQPNLAVVLMRRAGVAAWRVCERVVAGLGGDGRRWVRERPEVW